jgi:UTP--glucose-1-phosphate uridylyltransferase
LIGNEPFVVLWGDEMYRGKPSMVQQVITAYNETQAPTLVVMEQTGEGAFDRYGFVRPTAGTSSPTFPISGLIEKPGRADAPSPFASLGCYILTPAAATTELM